MKVPFIYFFLVALFLSASCEAQRHFIGTKEENRQLTWDDFKGTPDSSIKSLAYTYWGVTLLDRRYNNA